MSDTLSDDDLLRYSRHILLPEFDIAGQQRLQNAHALIIGLGGLGSPIALYLAAAGVRLTLVDHDKVDLSNLQRQILHSESSVGLRKTESARLRLAELNAQLEVHTIDERLSGTSLDSAVESADVVLDATDNFTTRFAINTACWNAGVPLISGAAIRWEGQISVFDPRQADSPCYQCLYGEGDDNALNCSENGIMGPVVGIIGTYQALEAIKLLANIDGGKGLVGQVLYFDGKRSDWRKFKLLKDPSCPTCAR